MVNLVASLVAVSALSSSFVLGVFGTASPIVDATLVKRAPPVSYTSVYLGDYAQPGSSSKNDQDLVTMYNGDRRPFRIQLWCNHDGVVSMIPWYIGKPGITDARHWTRGSDPPRGDYKVFDIKYAEEYIHEVRYDSCGKPGSMRICYLSISKINTQTSKVTDVQCGSLDHVNGKHMHLFCGSPFWTT